MSKKVKEKEAKDLVEKAKKTKKDVDIKDAENKVSKLEDKKIKEDLSGKLDELKKQIKTEKEKDSKEVETKDKNESKETEKKEIELKESDKKENESKDVKDNKDDESKTNDLGIDNEDLDFLDHEELDDDEDELDDEMEDDDEDDIDDRIIRNINVKKFNEKTEALKNKNSEDEELNESDNKEEKSKELDKIDARILDERDKLDSKDPDVEDFEKCIKVFESLNKISSYDEFIKNADNIQDTDMKDYLIKFFKFSKKITDAKDFKDIVSELKTFTVLDLVQLLPDKYCAEFEYILQNEAGENADNLLIFTQLYDDSDNIRILLETIFLIKDMHNPDNDMQNFINHISIENLTRMKCDYEYTEEQKEHFKELGIEIEYQAS